jgi:spore coat polysaccharide biosynthesis protein SpsF (cytidylyltransferase family)
MLQLGGLPSFVLAAKRSAYQGSQVTVLTSTDSDDDVIESACANHTLQCIRGPLKDVLQRFDVAAEAVGASNDDLIVRVTGDNTLPNGQFANALAKQLVEQDANYIGCTGPEIGLPYGVSAEVFQRSILRRAVMSAEDEFDREHVTPWIKRNARVAQLQPLFPGEYKLGKARATLDQYEDYLSLFRLWNSISNPIDATIEQVLARLEEMQ